MKSKRLFYSIIALFTFCTMLIAGTGRTYAQSFNSDTFGGKMRYFNAGNTNNISLNCEVDSIGCPPGYPTTYCTLGKAKYSENLTVEKYQYSYYNAENYTFDCDSEVVVFFDYSLSSDNADYLHSMGRSDEIGSVRLWVLSKSDIYFGFDRYQYSSSSWSDNGHNYNYTASVTTNSYTKKSFAYYEIVNNYTTSSTSSIPYGINTGNMKCFNDLEAAITYLDTGVIPEGTLAWEGSDCAGYDGNVHFNTFEIIPHDSNSYDAFYFEFRYEIPFDMINSSSSYYLDIDSTFEWTASGLADSVRTPTANYGVNRINLLDYPSGFKLYLDDIEAIYNFVYEGFASGTTFKKRQVLGSEGVIDLDGLSVGGFGGNTFIRISNSKIYLDCVLVCDGICGVTDHYDYDFLNGGGNYYSSTPDTSGNYMPNDDYKHTGYYYTDIGTDAAGNQTYNYYYYGDDNSRHEITAEDSHNNSYSGTLDFDIGNGTGGGGGGTASGDNSNNNVNNPTFNNNNNVNVTVEGDSINNDVDNIINNDTSNSKENSDSFIGKFLAFFNLLENNTFLSILGKLFGWLPAPVYAVITGSIGIVAGVSVFRFFRK